MGETATVLVVVVLAIAFIGVAIIFHRRRSFKATIQGPAGIGVSVEASDPQAPAAGGASISGAVSRQGGIKAVDHTGQGARIADADAKKDIQALVDRKEEGDRSKKA